MANSKNEMTQIKALEIVIAEQGDRSADVQAKLVEVYNALVKKKENRKPKEVAEEDKQYIALITETLAKAEKPMAIADIITNTDFGANLSSSKVTALVKKVDGLVITSEKKRNLYSIAE